MKLTTATLLALTFTSTALGAATYDDLIASGVIVDNATPQGYYISEADKALLVAMMDDPRQVRKQITLEPTLMYQARSRSADAEARGWTGHNPVQSEMDGPAVDWQMYFLGYWTEEESNLGFEYDLRQWTAEGHQLYEDLSTLPGSDLNGYEIKLTGGHPADYSLSDYGNYVTDSFDESPGHKVILWGLDVAEEGSYIGDYWSGRTHVGVGEAFTFYDYAPDGCADTSLMYFAHENANIHAPRAKLWTWELYWGGGAKNYLEASYFTKGEGWYESEWFGSFYSYQEGDGWIYQPALGWAWATGENASNFWIYPQNSTTGWTWTSQTNWPLAWSEGLQEWIWFSEDSAYYWSSSSNDWLPVHQ